MMEPETKTKAPRPQIADDNPMLAWVSLIHASTHLREGLETALQSELGLALAEQDLLKQIAANDGALTLTALARRIYLSKAGMTKMLDRLEVQGLLKREPDPADRRALRAALTRKGENTLAMSRAVLKAFIEKNFAAHMTPTQTKQLNRSLQALLDGLGVWDGQMAHLAGSAHE